MANLHPQIEKVLEAMARLELKPIEAMTPGEARAQMEQMAASRKAEPLPTKRIENRTIPGPAGAIPVRIYWPNAEGMRQSPLPAIAYYHGGGHVIGSLDSHDLIARNLCGGAEAIVVSIDYRMGPEHRFPAAVEDSLAGLDWLYAKAASLGADPERLGVHGDSAGANLAAVVALIARDRRVPKLRLQSLVYPVADFRMASQSYTTYATGCGILTAEAMKWFRGHYLRSPDDAQDWRASPVLAPNVAGVAPAIVIAAECDVLHDEGLAYAERLKAAGVPVEYKRYAGMIHAFFGMMPAVDDAMNAQRAVWAAFKRAFA
ncbi:MAG TPA: alpha/beta hydrolase [Stellaceae bacterium]|nr:alpha/beta hydrolase [Stellaceae bacterium]